MARIRTIKPEFWTSEQILELSRDARLLFIGMWNFCDDGGNHPASVKTLKASVLPADDITIDEIRRLVDELSSNDLIVLYESYESGNRKVYWHVTGWNHQRIDKPNFKYPKYNGNSIGSRDYKNDRIAFDERSKNTIGTVDEHSTTEGKCKGYVKEYNSKKEKILKKEKEVVVEKEKDVINNSFSYKNINLSKHNTGDTLFQKVCRLVDDPKVYGQAQVLKSWQDLGASDEMVLDVIDEVKRRSDNHINSLMYFDRAVKDKVADALELAQRDIELLAMQGG